MSSRFRRVLAILLCGIWVNASEFFRNEILLKADWVRHYRSLGLVFPSEPVNSALWIVWGFLFALVIFFITRRFNLWQSALLSWLTAFVLMWFVLFNLNVLPVPILVFAVPLSLIEAGLGAYICIRISPHA